MRTALLISEIKVGEFDIDDMSGIMTPYLETFIEGERYTILMTDYSFDFNSESVKVEHLLSEYPENNEGAQATFTFNTQDLQFDQNEQPLDFHQMEKRSALLR